MAKVHKPSLLTYNDNPVSTIIIAGGGNGAHQTFEAVKKLSKVRKVGNKGRFNPRNPSSISVKEIKNHVVGVAAGGDDGGSTGIILKHYPEIYPPGDLLDFYLSATNESWKHFYNILNYRFTYSPLDPRDSKQRGAYTFGNKNLTLGSLINMVEGEFIGKYGNSMTDRLKSKDFRHLSLSDFHFSKMAEEILDKHNLGNLIIAAFMLREINNTEQNNKENCISMSAEDIYKNSLGKSIESLASFLHIDGKVYPVTNRSYQLEATYSNRERTKFYTATLQREIDHFRLREDGCNYITGFKINYRTNFNKPIIFEPLKKLLTQNTENTVLITGPGSWYTSEIAAVKPIAPLLIENNIPIILILNNMTNPETFEYTNQKHVDTFMEHTRVDGEYINLKRIIYNNTGVTELTPADRAWAIKKGWLDEEVYRVITDKPEWPSVKIVGGNLLSNMRHRTNPFALSELLFDSGLKVKE